eukprot:TRINITY_DN7129_c0_g1_i1.p1 TRINITY_DN7129_c0_g1~~TRINITY_DN7129_c0_g1_i1.p1  ORF type:complete len:874 (+),score=148.91 TRINITY_DN7129_c0_g1_i1:71-2692(+)
MNIWLLSIFCFSSIYSQIIPIPPKEWDILGPFPYGYRELGADPLEAFGGITKIPRADNTYYPSELAPFGKVTWSKSKPDVNGFVEPSFNISWDSFGGPFGWAGQLWQGWALGDFVVQNEVRCLIQCVDFDYTQTFTQDMIYLDDEILNMNTVAYQFAWFPIKLSSGRHTIRIKISGQTNSEQFMCKFAPVDNKISILTGDDSVPDILDGNIVSPYVSFPILNTQDSDWIYGIVVEVSSPGVFISSLGEQIKTQKLKAISLDISVAPGQIYALGFQLSIPTITCRTGSSYSLPITIRSEKLNGTLSHNLTFQCKTWGESYTYTFLDFDGSVHYAAAYPPLNSCPSTGCPVLFSLHGAGVIASSPAWSGAYNRQKESWIIFPTGRRRFAFDWQGAGMKNAFTALNTFADDLPGVPATKLNITRANNHQVVYAGHSMGGHGCLELATHYPDIALAVVPAAGWIKWEYYVPFMIRVSYDWIDPVLQGLLRSSIAEYYSDLYTPNLVGIPTIVRMGGDDEVVPPWHLRRIARLLNQLNSNLTFVNVSEVPGQGHWFDGVVDDAVLQRFYDQHMLFPVLPDIPKSFEVRTLNPSSSGSRGGIQILQLLTPYKLGKITVDVAGNNTWSMKTYNVRRFGFASIKGRSLPSTIQVDSQIFSYAPNNVPALPDHHYCKLTTDWVLCSDQNWTTNEKNPNCYGPARQIYENKVHIIYGTQGEPSDTSNFLRRATWLSNNLYLTGRYVIEIFNDTGIDASTAESANLILLGGPTENLWTAKLQPTFPVKFLGGRSFNVGSMIYDEPFTGIMFIAPWKRNLLMVISGTDTNGFNQAFSIFPTHTGMTIPDFVVVGEGFSWKGDSGMLSVGFWSNQWSYDSSLSYVQ